MKKIIKLTETQLHKIVKRVLTEQRAGIIQQQDTDFCLIVCDVKHAKYGSNGEMVKKIQHLLAANGFNEKYVGGGMESGCDAEWPTCDGKFRKHTKDAVIEFQKAYNLKADGIVGPLTLKKMCEVLKNADICPDCKCDDIKQRPPRLDNEDLILPSPINDDIPGVGEYVPTGKDCATIVACIRQMGNNDKYNWIPFLKCLGKLKDKIFPPREKDNPFEEPFGCNPLHCLSGKPKTNTSLKYRAVITYYYDPITGKCKSFPVGAAPFRSLKQCQRCCEGKRQSPFTGLG